MKNFYKSVSKILLKPNVNIWPLLKVKLTNLEIFKPRLVRLMDKIRDGPLSLLPVVLLFIYENLTQENLIITGLYFGLVIIYFIIVNLFRRVNKIYKLLNKITRLTIKLFNKFTSGLHQLFYLNLFYRKKDLKGIDHLKSFNRSNWSICINDVIYIHNTYI